MSARLTIFVGAGGVGKTTLAASYALALARSGRRVGLLGIDPSRRLQSALGVTLEDGEVAIEPRLAASVLSPGASLRRWARDAGAHDRLLANPFFVAIADRLAAATDVIAAVRAAEWAERDPALDDLVVDTAPGLNAVEALRRPRQLAALFEGRVASLLAHVPGALAHVGGARLLRDLGEFFALVEEPIARLVGRLGAARRWLESEATRVVLVTAVQGDAGRTAQRIAQALAEVGMPPRVAIVNGALPEALLRELEAAPVAREAEALVRYARAYGRMQARVADAVAGLAPLVFALPIARGLDDAARKDALARLGARMVLALEDRDEQEGRKDGRFD